MSSCMSLLRMFLIVLGFDAPVSSDRQHLSYDVCLEVRGEIIRTVLCQTVVITV